MDALRAGPWWLLPRRLAVAVPAPFPVAVADRQGLLGWRLFALSQCARRRRQQRGRRRRRRRRALTTSPVTTAATVPVAPGPAVRAAVPLVAIAAPVAVAPLYTLEPLEPLEVSICGYAASAVAVSAQLTVFGRAVPAPVPLTVTVAVAVPGSRAGYSAAVLQPAEGLVPRRLSSHEKLPNDGGVVRLQRLQW